ncbi:YceD family protein [Flavobacterium sp. N2270]|uniref:YceD family protein n=1 Tax=Flavobacterium sp. N2270 TaxID=2986831 RepID=UPI002224B148|nr:DUF177 domain-containing protein [Flavobacterium sp. N2270]
MKNLKEFLIPFAGLKEGKHQFEYQIGDSFFEEFQFDEYKNVDVTVSLMLEKKSTIMELCFVHKGTVNVPCDMTGEDFDLKIKGKFNLVVKFGEEFNNENEELLILPHGEFQLNVSQYIYESIVLSVPFKRVHPGVKDGTLKTEAFDTLDKLAPKEEHKVNEDIDPRWENLKKLLTDK